MTQTLKVVPMETARLAAIDGVPPNLVSKGEVPYDAGSNENQREPCVRAGRHRNRGNVSVRDPNTPNSGIGNSQVT